VIASLARSAASAISKVSALMSPAAGRARRVSSSSSSGRRAARHLRDAAYPARSACTRTYRLICPAGHMSALTFREAARSRKCPADLPLRAERAASITTREYLAATTRTWTILLDRPCSAQSTRHLPEAFYQ